MTMPFATALKVMSAYATEGRGGWSPTRVLVIACVLLVSIGSAQNRRAVVASSFGLLALRLGFGMLTDRDPAHVAVFGGGAVSFAVASWLIGREIG